MHSLNHISVCKIALILSSISGTDGGNTNNRVTKSDIENHFEVLLNLYKINPLKQSKIYKQFSNRMLLPNWVDNPIDVLHFDSNESTRERKARTKVNLKQIEEAIHMAQPQHRFNLGLPPYTIPNGNGEKNDVEAVFDTSRLRKVKSKEAPEIFDSILDHTIESKEFPRKMHKYNTLLAFNETNPFIGGNRINLRIGVIEDGNKNFTLRNENSNRIVPIEEVVIMR